MSEVPDRTMPKETLEYMLVLSHAKNTLITNKLKIAVEALESYSKQEHCYNEECSGFCTDINTAQEALEKIK